MVELAAAVKVRSDGEQTAQVKDSVRRYANVGGEGVVVIPDAYNAWRRQRRRRRRRRARGAFVVTFFCTSMQPKT